MRRWPRFDEYADAVLDPGTLGDAELRDLELVLDESGRPLLRRGNAGTVFRFGSGAGSFAFKVFRGDVPDLRDRQNLIGSHLGSWSARTVSLVSLRYLDRGVFVDDRWYPAVRMETGVGAARRTCCPRLLSNGCRN